jgi:hypothetical protein
MFLRFRRATPIANLVEGRVVVIRGTIVPGERIVVPHAGVSCVGFDLLEESFGTGARGRGRPMWLPKKAEIKICRFALADGSGEVRIDLRGSDLVILGARSISGVGGARKRQRYTARVLDPGDLVKIRGMVTMRSAGRDGASPVIGPDAKGRAELLVVRHAAAGEGPKVS